MKKAMIILLVLFAATKLYAISEYEARKYGSQILVCGDNTTLRYWSLFTDNGTVRIFDSIHKHSFSLYECEKFDCTSNPARMYDCKFPDDRRTKENNLKQP